MLSPAGHHELKLTYIITLPGLFLRSTGYAFVALVLVVDRLCESVVSSVALVLVVDRLCEPVVSSVALVLVVLWYVIP